MQSSSDTNLSLRAWLASGPFTLAMSSGFFGFYAHAGFLRALEAHNIRPDIVRGSSAGALIAALWASGLDAETISRELTELKRADFWDPFPGPGILRGKKFAEKLSTILPVSDFRQCRTPLHISVFDPLKGKTVILSQGCLVTAVRASCAVPLMFHPVWNRSRPYYDGGILDRPGIAGAGADERLLYHHLVPKSFWRRKKARSSQIPQRRNMQAIAIPGLPKVSPFRLAAGRQALLQAYDYTMNLLDSELQDENESGGRPHT
jgi:NTE family protein